MQQIKTMAPAFYETLFNKTDYWSSFPSFVVKRKFTQEAAYWLARPATDKEIKTAIFQCNPDKSPGPDGFNAAFIRILIGLSLGVR